MTGESNSQKDVLNRLSRIEGQVRGISRMVDEDKYCSDILTQVSAASRALQSVALAVLDGHLSHCFVGDAEPETRLKEVSDVIAQLVRS